jgi:hypothetical protein
VLFVVDAALLGEAHNLVLLRSLEDARDDVPIFDHIGLVIAELAHDLR